MSEAPSTFDSPANERRRRFPVVFIAALVVGLGLYLATRNVIAGAILPAAAAGWTSLSTGLWLLRVDPSIGRARTCFAFYLATAFWKGGAGALITVFILIVVASITGQQPGMDQFAATMLTLTTAVVISTLIGFGATCVAVMHRIRVWVHPRLRTQLDGDLTLVRTVDVTRCGFNHAIFVVGTSLVLPVLLLGSCPLTFFLTEGNPNDVEAVPAIASLVFIVGGPFLMIPVYAWLSSRIIARNPQECWVEPDSAQI